VAGTSRRALAILVPSLVVVVASHTAFVVFPAHWGGPNIGGGLVLLAAYLGSAVGLVRLASSRRHRRHPPRQP
jgi:F0F1-type ATP synthase assembly protein I